MLKSNDKKVTVFCLFAPRVNIFLKKKQISDDLYVGVNQRKTLESAYWRNDK